MSFILPESIISTRRNRQSQSGILQFPSDLGVHGMLMIFKEYSYNTTQSGLLNKENISFRTQTNIKNAIMLPLPGNIKNTYAIKVQGFEQGIEGAAISSLASSLTNTNSIAEGINNSRSAILDKLPTGSESIAGFSEVLKSLQGQTNSAQLNALATGAAYLARGTILDKFGGARNIDVAVGNTVNPKSALFFEGVNLKNHSFQWTLVPSNKVESDIIRDIEKTIKQNALPSYTRVGEITRALLSYPAMVDIYFFGIDSDYFMYFKTCMIQTVDFDYTPQGLAVMKGGKPAAVLMNLQLMEADIHTAEDYDPTAGSTVSLATN
jgi:hypothetical protein